METVTFEMKQANESEPSSSGRYFVKLDDGSYDFRWFSVTDWGNAWMPANEPRHREVVAWSKSLMSREIIRTQSERAQVAPATPSNREVAAHGESAR